MRMAAAGVATAPRPPLFSESPASQPGEAVPTPTPTAALLRLGVVAVLPPAALLFWWLRRPGKGGRA